MGRRERPVGKGRWQENPLKDDSHVKEEMPGLGREGCDVRRHFQSRDDT